MRKYISYGRIPAEFLSPSNYIYFFFLQYLFYLGILEGMDQKIQAIVSKKSFWVRSSKYVSLIDLGSGYRRRNINILLKSLASCSYKAIYFPQVWEFLMTNFEYLPLKAYMPCKFHFSLLTLINDHFNSKCSNSCGQ